MVKIDLENTFTPIDVADDLSFMTFNATDKAGLQMTIRIEILHLGDPLLPHVYNLAFGPITANKMIDDKAKIHHSNTNKIFSTIVLFSLTYLQANPHATIGIDGSNDARAYMYHRIFKTNRQYLHEYFVTIGVDWYVRLLRNGNVEKDTTGYPFFKPKPEPFDYQRVSNDLYRYYMFHLRQ